MHPTGTQLQALGLMAAMEAVTGDLYEAYGHQFIARKVFFYDLAAQEREHARVITRFAEKVKAGTAHVALERFSPHGLLSAVEEIKGRLAAARANQGTLAEALYTALDIEESMLEGHRFELFESDGPELRQMLSDLQADTATHRRQVRLALEMETEPRHRQ